MFRTLYKCSWIQLVNYAILFPGKVDALTTKACIPLFLLLLPRGARLHIWFSWQRKKSTSKDPEKKWCPA